jgi:hypothetical protein
MGPLIGGFSLFSRQKARRAICAVFLSAHYHLHCTIKFDIGRTQPRRLGSAAAVKKVSWTRGARRKRRSDARHRRARGRRRTCGWPCRMFRDQVGRDDARRAATVRRARAQFVTLANRHTFYLFSVKRSVRARVCKARLTGRRPCTSGPCRPSCRARSRWCPSRRTRARRRTR